MGTLSHLSVAFTFTLNLHIANFIPLKLLYLEFIMIFFNPINTQKVSALILLDLSAAFDTMDQKILLSYHKSYFGISGTALSLLSSLLI